MGGRRSAPPRRRCATPGTHGIHDPADWKYHHVAPYEVNGVLPPNHAQL